MKKKVRSLLQLSGDRGLDHTGARDLLSRASGCRKISRGEKLPPPLLVTIDPINCCNLKCTWCNASFVMSNCTSLISKEKLLSIIDFLARWDDGVDAVSFSGGGEPLLHPDFSDLIAHCVKNSLLIAISTNGVKMGEYIEPLSECHWIGASIDVGSGALMKELKSEDFFEETIDGIRRLTEYSRRHRRPLTGRPLGLGVAYRYLVNEENVREIYQAAVIAKEAGCSNFYYRPASVSWDRLGREEGKKAGDEVSQIFEEQATKARSLNDEHFEAWGYTVHPAREDTRCAELFSTAIVMPSAGGGSHQFDMGLCYDRRGDEALFLGRNLEQPSEIGALWGSEAHWNIYETLDLSRCPQCPL